MRKEKEVQNKIDELRTNAFDILESNLTRSIGKKISIRHIRLVIDAMEYCLGKSKNLKIITENYNKRGEETP